MRLGEKERKASHKSERHNQKPYGILDIMTIWNADQTFNRKLEAH